MRAIAMFLLLACALSMKFSTNIAGLDKYCFFEILRTRNTKIRIPAKVFDLNRAKEPAQVRTIDIEWRWREVDFDLLQNDHHELRKS